MQILMIYNGRHIFFRLWGPASQQCEALMIQRSTKLKGELQSKQCSRRQTRELNKSSMHFFIKRFCSKEISPQSWFFKYLVLLAPSSRRERGRSLFILLQGKVTALCLDVEGAILSVNDQGKGSWISSFSLNIYKPHCSLPSGSTNKTVPFPCRSAN